jgi:hypothetical protein
VSNEYEGHANRTVSAQNYNVRQYAQEENSKRYMKLLDASHHGGCCRKCSHACINQFGLVRCGPKKKTVNGAAICHQFEERVNA